MRLLAAALCLFFEVGCAALLTGVASRTSQRLGHVNNVNMKLADNGILGVGIIGAGRIGIVHLEALSKCENAKAVIISNPTVSKAEAAANKFKLDAFTGDAMEVINHPDVEAGAPPASGRAGPSAARAPDCPRDCRRACARRLSSPSMLGPAVRSLDLLAVPVPRRPDQGLRGGGEARLLRCAAPASSTLRAP